MFYVLLPEQDTIKKGWEFLVLKFESDNNKEYKMEAIQDSAIHAKKVDRYLSGLYYLVTWKSYPEEENIWELFFIVIYLWNMVSTFHKEHSKKPTVTSAPLNSVPLMAKLTIQLSAKWKQERPTRRANKRIN